MDGLLERFEKQATEMVLNILFAKFRNFLKICYFRFFFVFLSFSEFSDANEPLSRLVVRWLMGVLMG